MSVAKSKVNSRGRITVPAEIRRKLSLATGSILQWREEGGKIVVRRAAQRSSGDIHNAIFPHAPRSRSLADMDEGIRTQLRQRKQSD